MTHTQKSDPRWSLKWLGTPGCRTQTCVIGEWMRYLKKSRPKRKEKELTNRKVWRGWVGACDRPNPHFFTRRAPDEAKAWREESEPSFNKQSAVAADAHYDASPTSTRYIYRLALVTNA